MLPLVTILVWTVGIVYVATFLILCSMIWTSSSEDEDDESHPMVVCSSSDESEDSIVITSRWEGPDLIFLAWGGMFTSLHSG